jgi:hypothetical protein
MKLHLERLGLESPCPASDIQATGSPSAPGKPDLALPRGPSHQGQKLDGTLPVPMSGASRLGSYDPSNLK